MGVLPSNKSKSSEQIHPGVFQDGKFSYGQRTDETPGLASEGGSYFLVPIHPDHHRYIPLTSSDIPVLLPALLSVLCPKSFHKADETSSGIPKGERYKINSLAGRHAGGQQVPRGGKGTCSLNQISLWVPGADHLQKKSQLKPLQDVVFLRYHISKVTLNISLDEAGSNKFVERVISVNLTDCCLC